MFALSERLYAATVRADGVQKSRHKAALTVQSPVARNDHAAATSGIRPLPQISAKLVAESLGLETFPSPNKTSHMNTLRSVLVAALAVACTATLIAQQPAPASTAAPKAPQAPRQRTSPHETTGAVIDGNRVTLVYGRPYSKDPKTGEVRKIWGGLVPYGKVWRTGSDEATLLITQQPINLGGAVIPAGAHTLWTLPAEDGSAKLIVNKEVGQWGVQRGGAAARDEKNDIAQVGLKKETLETPVDQFTMAVARNPAGAGGVIRLMWENTQYSAEFTTQK